MYQSWLNCQKAQTVIKRKCAAVKSLTLSAFVNLILRLSDNVLREGAVRRQLVSPQPNLSSTFLLFFLEPYRARKNRLQNVINTTQAGLGRLV